MIPQPATYLLVLGAPNAKELSELTHRTRARLNQLGEASPGALCAELLAVATGPTAESLSHRLALTGRSASELSDRLTAHLAGDRVRETSTGIISSGRAPRIAFLCSGQGGQFPGMGMRLHQTEPVYRRAFDRCAEAAAPFGALPLTRLLDPDGGHGPAIHRLPDSALATFAVGYALTELWRHRGVEPDVALGFTSGEYLAACVAGVLTVEDAITLLGTESALAARVTHGSMVVAGIDETQMSRFLAENDEFSEVSLAAVLSPREVSLSGDAKQLSALTTRLDAQGVRTSSLPVPYGLHSPLQAPSLAKLREKAATLTFSPPRIPLVSTVTGKLVDTYTMADPAHWSAHMRGPALFLDAVRVLEELDVTVCVEVGPGRALTGLGARCLPDGERTWIASLGRSNNGEEAMLRALGQVLTSGVRVNL